MPRSVAASVCARCCWWRPELFGVNRNAAINAGCAVEAIHAYSLIHDDLPCMDDDEMRHGKPTLHKAFDEATAVLAGIACMRWRSTLTQPDTSTDPFVRAELVCRWRAGTTGWRAAR